jgi:hypothetical protein
MPTRQAKQKTSNSIIKAEFRSIPLKTSIEIASERVEGMAWHKKDIPSIEKKKGEPILPDKENPATKDGLFMLSLAGGDVLARGIGDGYRSHILYGKRHGDNVIFDRESLLNGEDPRATLIDSKLFFTYTRIPNPDKTGEYEVGLASINPGKPHKVTEYGSIIGIHGPYVDCKDAVIIPPIDDRIHLLIRLKPGIQVVSFDSMEQLIELAQDPAKRNEFWRRMREDYELHPEKYNHLHPHSEVMNKWEARWRPLFREHIYGGDSIEGLLDRFGDRGLYGDIMIEGYHWYGAGPSPIKTEEGWLSFPHRGEVLAELTPYGVKEKKARGERLDELKFYCIFAALHDLDDPRKLIAVSPRPISIPDPKNPRVVQAMNLKDAVPFVNITAGAVSEERNSEPHILLMVGVNDIYTIPQWINQRKLLDWMLRYGTK